MSYPDTFYGPKPTKINPAPSPAKDQTTLIANLQYDLRNANLSIEQLKHDMAYYKELSAATTKMSEDLDKKLAKIKDTHIEVAKLDKLLRDLFAHCGKDPRRIPKFKQVPDEFYLKEVANLFWELLPGQHPEVASD